MRLFSSRGDLPGQPNDHFDGRRFFNPQPSIRRRGDFWRWMRNRDNVPWEAAPEFSAPPPPPQRVDSPPLVTWINHATVLIQTGGLNLITDPVFADRVSPLPHWGPQRRHPAGVTLDNLPPIDVVLISHAHYDHLDRASLRHLFKHHAPRVIAGLGLADWLTRTGATQVDTLDWWQSAALAGGTISVHATPARHWSRRSIWDRNRSLWLGYWIEAPDARIYFAGDTGFGDHFKAIRQRFGAPDLALLPIGAYEPRWFMAPQHMNPADAVEAHRCLHAERSIGIHFGTFKLTDEGRLDPVRALGKARESAGLAPDAFIAPSFGERFELASRSA